MKFRTLFVLVSLMTSAVFAFASQPDDRRFSSTLNLSESAQTGLNRLSSDQIAALDALVRHDAIVADADPTPKIPRAALFSQRLAANERELAGLALLNDSELAQLNASVERFVHPPVYTEAESDTSGAKRFNSIMLRRDPEIHGSVTLMVAGGSDGYSAYGGEINLTYYDPAHRFAIDLAYSEIRSKGGRGFCNRLYPYGYRRPDSLFPY